MIADTPDKEIEMNTENAPQVEMVSELPELPPIQRWRTTGWGSSGIIEDSEGEYVDYDDHVAAMHAYAQAALNARAGGDAKDAERWRALRTMTWRVHEIEPSEFDEHGDEAIAAALASQAAGVSPDAVSGLPIQWRHNAQGCGRRDAHAAATWRSCARELESALTGRG